MYEGSWTIRPCPHREVSALASALGITQTTASVLVRRGYGDPEEARAFLAGELPPHDPKLLGAVDEACAAIRGAIAAGKRICVHGDYDVDGICATALAVLVFRDLGADVGWHLPSRFEEGYGVRSETLARLVEEGYGLVLTVDCGITAVDEIAEARALGLEVVVTDHHRPGDELPACPVVATHPSDYPFPELCGTGVMYKLAQALGAPGLEHHLDLVALATIADVVPLVDENRAFAIAGLRRLAQSQRPGLRALMRSARVDPAAIDQGHIGFRLAPRINAAGRLCRPAAALELLLTENEEAASLLAAELEELNQQRQAVEDRILREALAQVEEWPEAKQRCRGYVLADEGWHEGVIGIVASRLVERFHRPVVLIAGTEGAWKGSGRSTGAFDLHGGLGACAPLLERFGGHRAAAGLSIQPERIAEFADAFGAQADAVLGDEDLQPVTRVDGVVPGKGLTLELCAELSRLRPFGLGNPSVTLLVAGCEISELAPVGDGKHLRFRVSERGRPSGSAIAFGFGTHLDRFRRERAWDVAFRLEQNQWNGTVSPQLVVRQVFETPDRYAELRERFAAEWSSKVFSPDGQAIFEELGLEEGSSWRSLLESERFRALLAELPLAKAA